MSEEVITAAITKGGARAESIAGTHFAAQLSIDGFPFVIDTVAEEGGDDLGPNPTRTLEGALAACGVMTMRMYAKRKGWTLDGAAIDVRRAEGADAHATRAFEKEITLTGPLSPEQRARLVEIADRCPVHRILSEGATIRSQLLDTED